LRANELRTLQVSAELSAIHLDAAIHGMEGSIQEVEQAISDLKEINEKNAELQETCEGVAGTGLIAGGGSMLFGKAAAKFGARQGAMGSAKMAGHLAKGSSLVSKGFVVVGVVQEAAALGTFIGKKLSVDPALKEGREQLADLQGLRLQQEKTLTALKSARSDNKKMLERIGRALAGARQRLRGARRDLLLRRLAAKRSWARCKAVSEEKDPYRKGAQRIHEIGGGFQW
jgi:hypothetical protein